MEDVKQLAQEVLQMRIALDRGPDGRMPPATKAYIQGLAADVNEALRLVYDGKGGGGALSRSALDSQQVPALLQTLCAAEELIVELNHWSKDTSERRGRGGCSGASRWWSA